MNTNMWMHPFTAKHLETLESLLDYKIISPISKLLACGDLGECLKRNRFIDQYSASDMFTFTGVGAMAEVESIVKEIDRTINCVDAKLDEVDLQ
jgi:phosphopantothenoylcysteine synthetase/decarboxylase